MRREIVAVVFFLKRLVTNLEKIESHKVELFVERLAVALHEKFKGHWYPENPSKGQAYRCIRVNMFHQQDPELLQACRESEVQYSDLLLPRELTLWVDPGEVCCRYGENNYCFSIATFSNEDDKDLERRVTSDCHSGSSSNEESAHTTSLPVPSRRCTYQALNPDTSTWHSERVTSFHDLTTATGLTAAPPTL